MTESTKPRIVIHQLAWLPHYFPLYAAARDLETKGVVADVRVQLASRGPELFRNAQDPEMLHVVLTAQKESYLEGSAYNVSRGFVTGSMLVDRPPLWIYVTEKFDISSKDQWWLVPPLESTLYREFRDTFRQKGLNEANFESSSDAFTIADTTEIERLLDAKNATAFVSIFPLNGSGKVRRLNVRPPHKFCPFTALWIRTETVAAETLRRTFSLLQRGIHEWLNTLAGCDADLLNASHLSISVTDDSHDRYVERVAETLKMKAILPGEWWSWVRSKNNEQALAWEKNSYELLAGLLTARIWDFNFLFSQSEDGTSSPFYSRSLAQFLLDKQQATFRSRLSENLDAALGSLETLRRLANTLGNLSSIIKGGTTQEEIDALNASDSLMNWLRESVFIYKEAVSWHDASPWKGNENAFTDRLRALCTEEQRRNAGVLREFVSEQRPSAKGLKRLVDVMEVLGGRSGVLDILQVYELKAFSKGRIPIPWLSNNELGLNKYLDLEPCRLKAAAEPNPLLAACHLVKKPSHECMVDPCRYDRVATSGAIQFIFRDAGASSKELSHLAAFVYAPKYAAEGGETFAYFRRLLTWGFDLKVAQHTQEKLVIELRQAAGETT